MHKHLLELTDDEALVVLALLGLYVAHQSADALNGLRCIALLGEKSQVLSALRDKIAAMTRPIIIRQLEDTLQRDPL